MPQYLHIILAPLNTVNIGSSVELKLIILQAWQERLWLKHELF